MSSPANRIREARERAGLWPGHVADAAGLNDAWYRDVEHDGTEVTGNISLAQLATIARLVGLTPLVVLEGEGAPAPLRRRSFADVAARARAHLVATGLTVEALSERVGWEMAPVLADPEHLGRYTADALRDICAELGMDWREALPE